MRCDLGCSRIATKWSQRDEIKLCNQCEFVVSSRTENSTDGILEYHAVDYSARGPDSALAGYSSGTGVFMHEMSGAMTDIFTKPAQGYKEDGAKGAMVGLVKGMGNMIIRPCQGAALFVDHVATGHYNQSRGADERKRGTVLLDNKGFRNSIGMRTAPEAHTGAMDPSEQIHLKKKTKHRQQIAVHVTAEDKLKMEVRFRDLTNNRSQEIPAGVNGKATLQVVTSKSNALQRDDDNSIPPMNICMLTTGSWEESVQQFVAVGLRLKADGHRVRIAAHAVHRDRIITAGLEFFPLGGRATTIGSFMRFLHEKSQDPKKSRGMFGLGRLRNRDVFSEEDDLKELMLSLWPACVDVDPLLPGKLFRADAIISHPLLFGQTTVAERLGVPLHCLSHSPLSRTQAFPHLTTSPVKLTKPYRYAPSNAESYDAATKATWEELRHLLDDFRVSLGLPGKSDWGTELEVTGYVRLEGEESVASKVQHSEQLKSLRAFVSASNTPIIYVGFARGDWDQQQIYKLLQTIGVAAKVAHVRVLFQLQDESDGAAALPSQSTETVLAVNSLLPRKFVLDAVQAALHWGDLAIVSSVLAAGKPACAVARNSTQRFWGQALASAGVGIEPLEIDMLSTENLSYVLQTLLSSHLVANAKQLADHLGSPEEVIEAAVRSFYENLPVAAMKCDLDPTRVARMYDPVNQLKLSYEAHVVVRQLSERDVEDAACVRYKPIRYSLDQPPRLSLRGFKEDAFTLRQLKSKCTPRAPQTAFSYDAVETEGNTVGKMLRGKFTRHRSVVLDVVETPAFWSSQEEQRADTTWTNGAYEQLLLARKNALTQR
ncbi:Sterol 3-beta-glucosyltransferase [Globisporangium polare]